MAKPTAADFAALTSVISQLNTTMAKQATTAPAASTVNSGPASIIKSIGDKLKKIPEYIQKLGRTFDQFTSNLNKVQREFGISIGGAATLQAQLMIDTAKDMASILTNIDWSAIGSGVMDVAKGLFGAVTGGGFESIDKMLKELNKPLPGNAPKQLTMPSEKRAGIQALQNEFGVMNKSMGEAFAQAAKDYGVSVDQLVKARRAFATIARGDLAQVERIQTRFFDEFKSKGLTPKVALEAINKYADLIARNGMRFADSFARAAADAKKIGVDLGRVDQFGDNIIDNFEGFLESQAELGAMGFGFDTSRLAQVAFTGDTGALQDELRSQLASMGKDINNLNRAERLTLEGATGMDIGQLQRLAGATPSIKPEEIAQDSNTKLGQILVAIQALGPLARFAELIDRANAIGVATAAIAVSALAIQNHLINKGNALREEGRSDVAKGNTWSGVGKGAAGGALTGTAYGSLLGLGLAGLLALIPGVGIPAAIAVGAGALGASAGVGAALGASDTYQKGRQSATIKEMVDSGRPMKSYIGGRTEYETPIKKSTGGLVTGPGTTTSDSIPALLSNGEYVLNAKTVSMLGADTLDKLNNIQKFADGGLVTNTKSTVSNVVNDNFSNKFETIKNTTKKIVQTNLTDVISNITTFVKDMKNIATSKITSVSNDIPRIISEKNIPASHSNVWNNSYNTVESLNSSPTNSMMSIANSNKIFVPSGVNTEQRLDAKNIITHPPVQENVNYNNLTQFVPDLAMQLQPSQQSNQIHVPPIDTSGIEQKLNSFIAALNNIQINMDGAKVGKALVNVNEVAMAAGVFRPSVRATL